MRILSLLCVYFMVLDSQGLVSVPAPENPKVSSSNFIHILEWNPGKGTQPGTVYNVKIDNNKVHGISGTSVNLTEYMKDKFRIYNIQLWASFGTRSSSIVNVKNFIPFESTIIGPPILSLSGCGDCLEIKIDLPNRQDVNDTFYNAVDFEIEWMKASNEKDYCNNTLTKYQSKHSVRYSYKLQYLEPGVRYCVKAQPKSRSISAFLSSCSCEFTSRPESRGVAFLASWVVGSLLVGLCFLSLIFSLIYSGFLCKPHIRLPKALIILVPGYFSSPEETCISVAEVECGIQIHKPKDHKEKKEKGNGFFKQNDDDYDVDEDDDEDKESHHGYMDRAVRSESESTGSPGSASVYEVPENSGGCSFKDTPTDAKKTPLSLSQLQSNRDKSYKKAASLDSITTNINPPCAKEGKILSGQMKEEETEEEKEEDDSGNINLWSVVLKSMQPEEGEANEPSEAKEPLLPLLLKELQEDLLTVANPQRGSSSEVHTALFHRRTESQSSQEDENDISVTSVCEHMPPGYMASHTGTIGTENYSSEDEEEDCTSGYMAR